ncbi:unnamed protein product [Clonostachys rosea f. rosea IK726]|jgi:hypothetical protein|uniref:Uncharacterized protein n=1 Tax=Clonostachys rosea f. rosea IK726 TaxID=1349383 RepID=A0ACA9T624_BIOOC|nr:unnamed protein product [Clonostachys rosea f. rosea IK726]
MAEDDDSNPELIPTVEWIESAGIQESLDEFFKTPFARDVNKRIEAARANPLPEAKSRKLIGILVEAILLLLDVNPASCPEATEDCVKLCVKFNILKHHAWGGLPFVRNPDRISARLLHEQALATKMQLALPFPEVGMLMVVALLLKLERGSKSATSRAIKDHFLFERAKLAALVYDRKSCSGIFAIDNCPERYSFTTQDDDDAPTVAPNTTSGPDGEGKWLRFGGIEGNREIVINDNDNSADHSPRSRKRLASETPQSSLLRSTPDAEREPTAKQTSNIHGTSRPIIHTGPREPWHMRYGDPSLLRFASASTADIVPTGTSRQEETPRVQAAPPSITVQSDASRNGSDTGVLPACARVLDDGKLVMEPEAVQEMFNAFRAIKGGLVESDIEVAGNAYNQMILAFPESLRDAMELSTTNGDTVAQGMSQTLRVRKVSSRIGRISKALEEIDERVASLRALLSHEHHAIAKLKQLLHSLEDELE